MTNPTAERDTAPVTAVARPKRLERQGNVAAPMTSRLPQIRGGVCEKCGILDSNTPSQHQYKLCEHFRGLGTIRCSYCDGSKDADDVIYHSTMNIAGHPDDPDKLIAWCDSYECRRKHLERFNTAS